MKDEKSYFIDGVEYVHWMDNVFIEKGARLDEPQKEDNKDSEKNEKSKK